MRRFMLIATILALATAVQPGGREERTVNLYLGTGLAIPTGNAGKGWNLGFHGEFGVGFIAVPHVEIVPTMAYHIFSLDKQGSTARGGTLSVLTVGGDLKISFGGKYQQTRPFLFAGAGLGNASVDAVTVPAWYGSRTASGASETKMYFDLGAGVDIESSLTTAVNLRMKFVNVSTSGSAITYIPLSVGLRF